MGLFAHKPDCAVDDGRPSRRAFDLVYSLNHPFSALASRRRRYLVAHRRSGILSVNLARPAAWSFCLSESFSEKTVYFLRSGWSCGLVLNAKSLGFLCSVFGVVEIAIHAVSDVAQAVFVSAIPTVEAAIIPIMVRVARISVLIASVFFRDEIGDILKPRRALVTKPGLMTFPLYLNHYTLGRVLIYSLISAHVGRPAVFAISLAVIFGSSWLIMTIPEPAIQARLRKFLRLDISAAQQIIQTVPS
jgi:hypothetical protein